MKSFFALTRNAIPHLCGMHLQFTANAYNFIWLHHATDITFYSEEDLLIIRLENH